MKNNEIIVATPALSLLGVLFVALKLTGHINWPWWAVTLPLWGPWALIGFFIFFALFIGILVKVLDR